MLPICWLEYVHASCLRLTRSSFQYKVPSHTDWQHYTRSLQLCIMLIDCFCTFSGINLSILSRATYPWAPSYGGVRTWVESSLTRRNCALAEASNLFSLEKGLRNIFRSAFLIAALIISERFLWNHSLIGFITLCQLLWIHWILVSSG